MVRNAVYNPLALPNPSTSLWIGLGVGVLVIAGAAWGVSKLVQAKESSTGPVRVG